MSMDNFRIPILVDSCRKFIPKKQRITIFETFEVRTKEAWNKKGEKFSGDMVETRRQKFSGDRRTRLKVEIYQFCSERRSSGTWNRRKWDHKFNE